MKDSSFASNKVYILIVKEIYLCRIIKNDEYMLAHSYEFGIRFDDIYNMLKLRDGERNGVLKLLDYGIR